LVYVSSLTAALGAVVFGYDIGGSGGTFIMDTFRTQMNWGPLSDDPSDDETNQKALITSMFAIGAMCGALPSGTMADHFGRKRALQLAALVFSIGVALQASCSEINQLIVGRFIGGAGVGMLSMMMSVFMSEISPESIRGMVITLMQLGITFGIVLAAVLNIPLADASWGWRFSYGGNGILSVIMIGLLAFLPESPRFLMMKKRTDEAREALQLLRQDVEIEPEMESMRAELAAEEALGEGSWKDVISDVENMDYRMLCGFMIQFWQQFTGINAIMYFAPVIFSLFLEPKAALGANIAIMTVNFLATFVAFGFIDKQGRRALLVFGGALQCSMCFIVAILASNDYKNNGTIQIAVVICIGLYVIGFAMGWGPVPWVVCAEIFPQRLRGKAMSISTATNWWTNFIIGQTTPFMLKKSGFDLWGTFVFYGSFCLIMNIWVLIFLPETKGVSLEKMESVFIARRAHLKKSPYSCLSAPLLADKTGFESDVEMSAGKALV
jgi:sugar porter (SP) family MFS transporter